jgi:hypothetical protein
MRKVAGISKQANPLIINDPKRTGLLSSPASSRQVTVRPNKLGGFSAVSKSPKNWSLIRPSKLAVGGAATLAPAVAATGYNLGNYMYGKAVPKTDPGVTTSERMSAAPTGDELYQAQKQIDARRAQSGLPRVNNRYNRPFAQFLYSPEGRGAINSLALKQQLDRNSEHHARYMDALIAYDKQ